MGGVHGRWQGSFMGSCGALIILGFMVEEISLGANTKIARGGARHPHRGPSPKGGQGVSEEAAQRNR